MFEWKHKIDLITLFSWMRTGYEVMMRSHFFSQVNSKTSPLD